MQGASAQGVSMQGAGVQGVSVRGFNDGCRETKRVRPARRV
jgi:hypothetical protein